MVSTVLIDVILISSIYMVSAALTDVILMIQVISKCVEVQVPFYVSHSIDSREGVNLNLAH